MALRWRFRNCLQEAQVDGEAKAMMRVAFLYLLDYRYRFSSFS